jgi:RND family efflux transporter MFP subunit
VKAILFGVAGLCLVGGLGTLAYVRSGAVTRPPEEPLKIDLSSVKEAAANAAKREDFAGIIVAVEQSEVQATLSARVQSIDVRPGTLVKKGDPLITLDPDTIVTNVKLAEEKVRSAESALRRASGEAKIAKVRYDQAKKLLAAGAGSLSEVQTADAAYNAAAQGRGMAQSDLNAAKESLKNAETASGDGFIRSPLDGKVSEVFASVGMQLAEGTPVARVFNPDKVRVVFAVDPSRTHGFDLGKPLLIQVERSDETITGEVTSMGAAIDVDLQAMVCEGSLAIPEALRNRPWVNLPVRVSLARAQQAN